MCFRGIQRPTLVFAAMIVSVFGTLLAENVSTVIVSQIKKKQWKKVTIDPVTTKTLKHLNERLAEITKLWESGNLEAARGEYRKLLATTNAPPHYRSYTHLRIAQSYMAEKNTAATKVEYEKRDAWHGSCARHSVYGPAH